MAYKAENDKNVNNKTTSKLSAPEQRQIQKQSNRYRQNNPNAASPSHRMNANEMFLRNLSTKNQPIEEDIDDEEEVETEEENAEQSQEESPPEIESRPVNESRPKASVKNVAKTALFAKYKIIFIIIIVVIIFFFMLLLVGMTVFNSKDLNEACNFNLTTVTVTNCYQNESDRQVYGEISLDDFVIGAAYAYSNGKEYSNEALKAAMIAIKTNTLSKGGYSSSNKNIEIKSCSMGLNYCNPETGCSLIQENFYENVTTYKNEISTTQVETTPGDDSDWWWPIGSNETTTQNGKTYASGSPALAVNPTDGSAFGPRALNGGKMHYGIDMSGNQQIGVYNIIATKSGTVTKVYNGCADNGDVNNNCGGQRGNHVIIDHGNGITTYVQHMARNSITVKVGDHVDQGQVLGKIGQSGRCTGPHLHFEVRINGSPVDPMKYVNAKNPRPTQNGSSSQVQEQQPSEEISVGENDIPSADSTYLSKLKSAYNSISDYIFVSSSYNSTIQSLSPSNALAFDETTLDNFETISKSDKNYSSILSETYNKKEENITSNNNDNDNNNNNNNANTSNTIFVGDSRTYGLYGNVAALTDENTVAAGGQAYIWFKNNTEYLTKNYTTPAALGGINGVNSLIKNNGTYNIVTWLGVNDMNFRKPEEYVEAYAELLKGQWSKHTIYVLPIGPVDDAIITKTYPHLKNSAINEYNNNLKNAVANAGLKNLIYLDVDFNSLNLNCKVDGLHYYNKKDNENIYNMVMSAINNGTSISSGLKLYKYTDYCQETETIEVTDIDNDLFWWPVGSNETTTQNGVEIASGQPALTRIPNGGHFGPRVSPCPGCSTNHRGIDIGAGGVANKYNAIASRDGTVVSVEYNNVRGYLVKLDHGDGMQTLYQHLHPNTTRVKVGDKVVQGQVLAKIGGSGRGTGPHLHFEVQLNNVPVNPEDYVSASNPRPINIKASGKGSFTENGDASVRMREVCTNLQSAYGFSKIQTIGIMTNIRRESHEFDPKALNGSSKAYGLIQWLGGRKINLQNQVYCSGSCAKYDTLEGQLQFMMFEFKGSEAAAYKKFLSADTERAAAYDLCFYYERPGRNNAEKSAECNHRVNLYLNEMSTYVNNGCK